MTELEIALQSLEEIERLTHREPFDMTALNVSEVEKIAAEALDEIKRKQLLGV